MEKNELNIFFQALVKAFHNIENQHEFPIYFYNAVKKGENVVSQSQLVESKVFSDDWLNQINALLPSIVKITQTIKSSLKRKDEVVIVEKAKRTDSKSIRHLAINTQLIREVKKGNVIPKKVLTHKAEIKIATYENRFIKSLILKLIRYVRDRKNLISSNVDALKTTNLVMDSKFPFEREDFEIKIDLKRKENITRLKVRKSNLALLEQVENLERQLGALESSEFMQLLRNDREFVPPIIRTTIITKNPDFRNAYNLWVYLDKNPDLTFEMDTHTRQKRFTDQYRKHLTQNLFHLLTTTLYHDKTFKADDYRQYTKGRRVRYRPVLKRMVNLDLKQERRRVRVESNLINEYYLQESKKIFDNLIEEFTSEGDSKVVSTRRAITEMLEVTNAIYKSYFDLTDLDVIFKPGNSKEQLKDSLDKYRLVRMVREVKERDLKKTMDAELRWLKLIKRHYSQLERSEQEKAKIITSQRLLADLEKFNEYKIEKQTETLDVKKTYLEKHRQEMTRFRNAEKQRFEKRVAKHKEDQRKKLQKERERIKKQKQALLKREREKRRKEKQILKEKERQQKALVKEQYKKRLENL